MSSDVIFKVFGNRSFCAFCDFSRLKFFQVSGLFFVSAFPLPTRFGQIRHMKLFTLTPRLKPRGQTAKTRATKPAPAAERLHHNRSGWQVNTATTNGAFQLKNPQFHIVEIHDFSYIFQIRSRTNCYLELHHNYVEYC